ncbi:MAG TPA: ATP-binding cassette domain-containing protein [Candidatus Dormibacteraeota bacterium]|nr:ATP-binding cassette domain-containing protein [Candidatus Dormibacteraeota bacterium]
MQAITARSPAHAIEVEDLTKVYPGGNPALNGISFAVDRGEIFGFLGPNGSGKTTTVRILVTLLRATSGTASVGGFDVERMPGRIRQSIGYTAQATGVDDDLTVHEHLVLQALLHGLPPSREQQRRIEEVIETFSLSEVAGERAGRLSGGLRRRLDIAQAVVHRPPVLFLDEPTIGLDPQSRNALWRHLRGASQEGTTIFLTTQYLEEADRACDRIAIIDGGRLVKEGTPTALKSEVGEGRLRLTLADSADSFRAARALALSPDVVSVESGDALVVRLRSVGAGLADVVRVLDRAGIPIETVETGQPTLDDVFLRYTGRAPRSEAPAGAAVSSLFAAAHGRRRR